jgi:hypothetical protein
MKADVNDLDEFNWACAFGLHRWMKWAVTDRGQLSRTGKRDGEIVGLIVTQERKCTRCGFTQTKTQKEFQV